MLAGAITLIQGRTSPTVAKKKKGKRVSSPSCPAPTTCPPLDTCPVRSCCVCVAPSTTPGCRTIPVATSSLDELNAACEQACGGPGTAGAQLGTVPGQTLVCNDTRSACERAACPL
jgi:hypothetical protein